MDIAINETQDINLSPYKWQGDWRWYQEAETADSKRIAAQIDYLTKRVRNMNTGDRLSVIDICNNPKYYDVCVKILCVLIDNWRHNKKDMRDYVFNEKFTEVRRVS